MSRWSKKVLLAVWKRGKCCYHCGTDLELEDHGKTWDVDHVIPKARGGTDSLGNLVASCIHCNRSTRDNHGLRLRLRRPILDDI
jgi:5-methylcytosine-specific restriction endonuclease McrA